MDAEQLYPAPKHWFLGCFSAGLRYAAIRPAALVSIAFSDLPAWARAHFDAWSLRQAMAGTAHRLVACWAEAGSHG